VIHEIVNQNVNVLAKMMLDLLEAPRMHEIVGIYETQDIDTVLKGGSSRVPIGGGTGLFGRVLEHDGERTGG
jgi:hypothetical protein